jgi:hypothetical protein
MSCSSPAIVPTSNGMVSNPSIDGESIVFHCVKVRELESSAIGESSSEQKAHRLSAENLGRGRSDVRNRLAGRDRPHELPRYLSRLKGRPLKSLQPFSETHDYPPRPQSNSQRIWLSTSGWSREGPFEIGGVGVGSWRISIDQSDCGRRQTIGRTKAEYRLRVYAEITSGPVHGRSVQAQFIVYLTLLPYATPRSRPRAPWQGRQSCQTRLQ